MATLKIDENVVENIARNNLKLLRYRRLIRILQSRERTNYLVTPDTLGCQSRWMNYLTKVQKGMICELCEQLVPETARDLDHYKCETKYCCKEHQKSACKVHHRSCRSPETTQIPNLITPVDTRLTNGQIQATEDVEKLLDNPSNLNQNLNTAKYVIACLAKYGHCILDNFHGESIAKSILNEVETLHGKGSFKDGQLQSRTGHGTSNRKVREDEIIWMNGNETDCGAISQHMSTTDTLLQLCNIYMKENEIEHRSPAMVACYPGKGTGYKRHIDNPNKDGRLITTLYYLNQGWNTEVDGGVLKLFPEQKCFPESSETEVHIEPVFDRLLLFWSDKRNPHEVCPAYRRRFAITLWYFDSAERRMFFEQLKEKQMTITEQSKESPLPKEAPKSTVKKDRK